MSHDQQTNDDVADVLDRAAELLELEDANPFRVRSYRSAAETVRHADPPVADRLRDDGPDALRDLPGIGDRLAGAIREIVDSGRLRLVDDLEARITPEAVLSRVPGLGDTLAARVHEQLGIDSLEELEIAAHDGRLARVEGIGDDRLRGVRDALAGMLARSAGPRSAARRDGGEPPVGLILDVDREYRERAEQGELRTIAPRRFNPEVESWLPILETDRDGWRFTALYSNTARAHRLGKTDDWVVVYFQRGDDDAEGQHTVVTATSGPLEGHRMVVGREAASREHHGLG